MQDFRSDPKGLDKHYVINESFRFMPIRKPNELCPQGEVHFDGGLASLGNHALDYVRTNVLTVYSTCHLKSDGSP